MIDGEQNELPIPSTERFKTLRQSRLATFDRCALSAHFEEEYRNNWDSHPSARGTLFHRFAAKALRAMVENQEKTVPTDLALSILHETLRQHDIDRECPTCLNPITSRTNGMIYCAEGHEHQSSLVNMPGDQIKDLRWVVVKWAHDNAFDIDNLVSVEERLAVPIKCLSPEGDWYERILTGQLDALFVTGAEDDEAIVLDWKDTWMLPAPTEVGFDGYFQQRFYAWLVFKTYPTIQRVTLREFYVRRSEPREATVWRTDIEDIEAEMSALAERFDRAFEEQNFPPSPGAHCQFCPRPGACPIFSGVKGEGMITDEEMARRVAGEAIVIKAALDQRLKALRGWSTVHGAVEISDHKGKRVWGYQPATRTSRPKREEIEAAMSINGPENLNLDELYETKQVTRFAPHIPREDEDIEPTADDAKLMSALQESIDRMKADGDV